MKQQSTKKVQGTYQAQKDSKKKLNFFQLLKTGTSFQQKEENNRFQKQTEKVNQAIRDSSQPKRKLSDNNLAQKYNENDSDDSDNENLKQLNEQITQTKSRRKMSIDELEKDWEHQQQLKQAKIKALMKLYKVKIEGDNIPPLLTNFTKMQKKYGFNQKILDNMKKAGYEKPTPIQMQSVPIIMEKRNLLALAPTGSGKTAAYCLPLLQKLGTHQKNGVRALIFAPSNELAEQILREFEFLNYGVEDGLRIKQIQKINNQSNAFKIQLEHIDILITTPLKFIKMNRKSHTEFDKLEYIVFDEADRYFEFNIAGQMKRILETFQEKQGLTYLLFSATIQHPVEELVKNIIIDPLKLQIGGKNNVLASIEQSLSYCQSEYGKLVELKNIINNGEFNPPVLIFVQSKERGEELLSMIKSSCVNTPIKIDKIDSDKQKEEREETIEDFRTGKLWALICTDLMARGIDFKGVNLVINYDFPTTMINYIHRVGRTGRAGRAGKAITFFTNEDKPLLRSLGNMLKVSGCDVPEWIFKIQKADKKTLKRLEKFPVKRDAISLDPSKQKEKDLEFEKQIRIADGQYFSRKKKIDREERRKQKENEDDGWQIA
ncbi:hypothetical protein ABPG72_008247 [Tetrahymena utriculariae]